MKKSLKKFINKITLGDCLNFLEEIPTESIDVCFADPPFNLKKKYNSYKDSLGEAEYLNWCEKWLIEFIRITKPSGSIFIHNIPQWLVKYATLLNKEEIIFKKWISWDAPTGANGNQLQPSHYGILYYVKNEEKNKFYKIRQPHKRERTTSFLLKDWGGKKDSLHPFGTLVSDVWTDIHRVKHNKFKDSHPCQLPIHLMQRLILMSTDKNDIVLDPFMGTGTTAIAAISLDRKFIGFELDKNYVKISNDKLAHINNKSKLGKSYVSYFNKDIVTIRDTDWIDIKQYFVIPEEIKDINANKISLIKNHQLELNFIK